MRVSGHVPAEARVRDAVVQTNWEGAGVVPDIRRPPVQARAAAIEALSAP